MHAFLCKQRKETVSNPPYQVQPELMSAGGRSQNTSEAKENFRPISNPGPRQKPSITKNESHIYNDGSFDAQTLNRETFRPISNPGPRQKPSITKNESTIWNEGSFDSVTLNRQSYQGQYGHEKQGKLKAEDKIKLEGDMDSRPLNRLDYPGMKAVWHFKMIQVHLTCHLN